MRYVFLGVLILAVTYASVTITCDHISCDMNI